MAMITNFRIRYLLVLSLFFTIKTFERSEDTHHAEPGKGERGDLRRIIGMTHFGINPGVDRCSDHRLGRSE